MKIDIAAPDAAVPTGQLAPPFFMVGCVRSGTTMLRDALRMHPGLASPEETHFFRWGDPFGTDQMMKMLSNNAVLQKHRELDGITEAEFKQILNTSTSRAELYVRYMALFVRRKKPAAKRWFDKTPQNVYGVMLAATTMPRAKFVHIVRNPLNVVASLRIGKVMKVPSLVGAVNYWNESINIIAGLKRAYPLRLYELRYEDFVASPETELPKILEFLREEYDATWFEKLTTKQVDHTDEQILTDVEAKRVVRLCETGMKRYQYLTGSA